MGRLVLVLAIIGASFWLVGSQVIDRARNPKAVAESFEERVNSVAGLLRQATANGQKRGTPEERAWQEQVNRSCTRQDAALGRLGTPRSLEEVAAYLRRALPHVRGGHARFASAPPPASFAVPAERARRAFAKQEAILVRMRRAARREDAGGALAAAEDLRTLTRAANPDLIGLGLTECTLPSWGVPL